MKLLLTGSGGLLGKAIAAEAASRSIECKAFVRDGILESSMTALVTRIQGSSLLIHAAANTNVEQCEIEPAASYRDNFLLTERLAQAAATAGVRMVFISSTGVYGTGAEHPYCEFDATVPTTHHHRSKLLAEQAVILHPVNMVVRTGWLFGGGGANPKNFVARRLEEARAAVTGAGYVASNSEQRGNPSYVVDVADRLLDLVAADVAGIVNCVNRGDASRYQYVSAIVAAAGLAVDVRQVSGAAFNRKAQVSPNEMALNWKMDLLGWPPMPAWQDSLKRYIKILSLEAGTQ